MTDKPPAMPELSRGEIIDLISPSSNNSADHDIEFARRVIDALQSAQQAVPMTEEQIVAAFEACDQEDLSKEGWIRRTRIKWARAIEAHHGITAQGAQEGV